MPAPSVMIGSDRHGLSALGSLCWWLCWDCWLSIYSLSGWCICLRVTTPSSHRLRLEGLYLYFWGLPMEGLLLVGASFFQAINYSREASMLTASKLLLIGLMLWLMAALFGTTGVWMSLPITSSLLFVWMWVAVRRVDKDYL